MKGRRGLESIQTGMPPARCTSSMWYLAVFGATLARHGTLREIASMSPTRTGRRLTRDAVERPPLVVAGNREDGARVPFRQEAALDQAEDVLRQLEEPDAVRHRRLRAPDALCDFPQRE